LSIDLAELAGRLGARMRLMYVDRIGDVLASLAVATAVVVCVLAVELAFTGWQASSLRRLARVSPSARTDLLAFFLIETSLALVIGMAMFFGATYVVQKLIAAGLGSAYRLTFSSAVAALVVYYVVFDLAHYWSHRLCHRVPALWELHRYHHSAPEMTVLTALRDHPMERAFTSLVIAVPAALIALPVQHFIVIHTLAKTVGLLKHSNLLSNWGWFGRYVLQSPAAHRVHHSSDPAHYNANFGSLFQFWDVVFGTAVHPERATVGGIRIGLADDSGQTPALRYLGRVFVAGWSRALRSGHG
jgi:sterol desaturase/sphingolipid hydroxylase (fatty acid hydroxylase superfamily)